MRAVQNHSLHPHLEGTTARMTTTLSTYEEQREENIARNRRVLESLEIWPIANAGGSTPAPLAPCPTHAVGAAANGPDSESGSNHEWAGSSTSSSFDGRGSSSGTNPELSLILVMSPWWPQLSQSQKGWATVALEHQPSPLQQQPQSLPDKQARPVQPLLNRCRLHCCYWHPSGTLPEGANTQLGPQHLGSDWEGCIHFKLH